MVGLYEILPPGARLPRMRGRVEVKIGEPLDFSRYAGQDDNKLVLRSATDELMYELMLLSGQQYVDEYAASVKAGEVDIGSGSLLDLGRQVDAEKRAA
jgi:1-acyl-sn-glycerol-3-phosphate acyltransferase